MSSDFFFSIRQEKQLWPNNLNGHISATDPSFAEAELLIQQKVFLSIEF